MNRLYPIGDPITLTVSFTNPATGLPINPSAVLLRLLDPNKLESRPVVSNTGVGLFTATFSPTVSGFWHARWEATGNVMAAIENQFEVTPSAFGSPQ